MSEVQLQSPSVLQKRKNMENIKSLGQQQKQQKHHQYSSQIRPIQQHAQQKQEIQQNPPFFKDYFQSRIVLNNNQAMVANLTEQKLIQMNHYIERGHIKVPQNSKHIEDIINKTSKQEQKIQEYIQHKGELQNQLKRMEDVIKNSQNAQPNFPRNKQIQQASFISSEEHKKIVEKISKIKKQIEEKRKLHAQYQQNRLKQLQKKQQENSRKQHEQQLEQKHKQLKQRIQKIMERRQKMKQESIQSSKRFKSVRQQKRRHSIMQQEFHSSIILPMIQENNKILQERVKKNHLIKVENIKQYEKSYMKNKEQRQKLSRSKESSNWHYKTPSYSSSMMKLIQSEKKQQKIRQEEEKKRLESLRKRQETYKEYLNQRFSSVKIDEKKRQEIQVRLNKQKIDKGLTQEQTRELGNKYLVEIKSKLKQNDRDKKESLSTNQQTKKPKIRQTYKIKSSTSMSNYASEPSSSPSISELTSHKIDKIISSHSTKYQKVQKIKIEVDKLSENTSRKKQLRKYIQKNKEEDREDIQNLLSSIQAKVNIIELYKQ